MKRRILSCVVIWLLVAMCVFHKELFENVKREEMPQSDPVNEYLLQSVPELHNYADYIIEKSNGEAHLTIQIFEPAKKIIDEEGYEGEFYAVYVGEQREAYRVNWDWFYVESNLSEVLWYNLPEDDYYTLVEWRQSEYYRNL